MLFKIELNKCSDLKITSFNVSIKTEYSFYNILSVFICTSVSSLHVIIYSPPSFPEFDLFVVYVHLSKILFILLASLNPNNCNFPLQNFRQTFINIDILYTYYLLLSNWFSICFSQIFSGYICLVLHSSY